MLKLDVMFCIFSMVCWTVSPSSFKRSCWEVTCSVDLFHKFSFYFLSFKLPVLFYCAAYFFQLYHKTLLLKGKTLQRKISIKVKDSGEFSGSPLVETSSSNAGGLGSIPGQGVKIPHVLWQKQTNKQQKKIKNKKRQAGCPDAISDKNISCSRKTLQELIMKRIGFFFSSHFASETTLTLLPFAVQS